MKLSDRLRADAVANGKRIAQLQRERDELLWLHAEAEWRRQQAPNFRAFQQWLEWQIDRIEEHGEEDSEKHTAYCRIAGVVSVAISYPEQAMEKIFAHTPGFTSPSTSPVVSGSGEAVAKLKATSVEFDDEATSWYINILDEPVDHTTEGVPVAIDWTRDGSMVGIELLDRGRERKQEWGIRHDDNPDHVDRCSEASSRILTAPGVTPVHRTVTPWEDAGGSESGGN